MTNEEEIEKIKERFKLYELINGSGYHMTSSINLCISNRDLALRKPREVMLEKLEAIKYFFYEKIEEDIKFLKEL